MNKRGIGVLMVGLLVACSDPDEHGHAANLSGVALYNYHCAGCHGDTGSGKFLRGVPPVRYTEMTYRELVDHILGYGRKKGTRMPVFETMPKAEAERIAVFIRRKLKID